MEKMYVLFDFAWSFSILRILYMFKFTVTNYLLEYSWDHDLSFL